MMRVFYFILFLITDYLLSTTLATGETAPNAHHLTSRSMISQSCQPNHKTILNLFVLRAIGDLTKWGSEVIEDRPLEGSELDDLRDQIFQRRVRISMQRWFSGPGTTRQSFDDTETEAAVRLFALFVELGGSSVGAPLSHESDSSGHVYIHCDYDRPSPRSLCRDMSVAVVPVSEANTILLCPGFWTRGIVPTLAATPQDETQFGLLTKAMLKMPPVYGVIGIKPGDDDRYGRNVNVNRYMWYMQDIYIQWLRLKPPKAGRGPIPLPFPRNR